MRQVITALIFLSLCAPTFAARLHHAQRLHHVTYHNGPFKYKRVARTGDYARGVGLANDTVLSTGWTGGHGLRQTHVHDYYRHTRSGRLIHVHGYYRR